MHSKPFYVFIPAYNEAESIGKIIEDLKRVDVNLKIFVIDDGSNDGTDKCALNSGAIVVRHPVNLGGGAAIKTAFSIALMEDIEYFITLDGDGQHDPNELTKFINVIEEKEFDLIIGSRFYDNCIISMKKYRMYGIRFFSLLFSIINKVKLTDVTCCYRIYKTEIIKTIFDNLNENQYYAIEILNKIVNNNGKIFEIPIEDLTRISGKSKKGLLRYFYNLLRIILNNIYY